MKTDTVMGVMMKLKVNTESIEGMLKETFVSSLHSAKNAANVSLIPSLSTPFGGCELQEALKKASERMLLLDAMGSQADTLLYAEDSYFTLYQSAVKEVNDTQLFLLLSPCTSQEGIVVGSSRLQIASCDLLLAQLYAALRASAKGKIALLVPSTSTVHEIDTVRQMLAQAMRRLRAQSIPFDETVSLGIVLSTPASLLLSRRLIEAVDLVMIDTDPLAELSLNLTPVSKKFDNLLGESAEAILRLIEVGVGNAHLLGRFVMLGGRLATDPRFLPHLVAMGVDGLTAPPQKLRGIKAMLRKSK